MRNEHQCGRIGVNSLDEIAWRVAKALDELERPWALTLDPEGLVMLERVKNAHPDDLLGVFDCSEGRLTTSRLVLEELREVMRTKPPREKERRVIQSRRPRKAA